LTASRLAYRGKMVGDLTATGKADRKQLRLESLTLVNNHDRLAGQATIPARQLAREPRPTQPDRPRAGRLRLAAAGGG